MADSGSSELAKADERWRLHVVGRFAVFGPTGEDVTPRGRKDRAVLAYLITRRGDRVPRERLMELLWGDRGEAQARSSLRQSLAQLRGATRGGPELVSADRDHVWIAADHAVAVSEDPAHPRRDDAQLFDDLDHITPAFDEWLAVERVRWARETGGALRLAAVRSIEQGDAADAIPLIERIQRLDPFDEEGLRLAMQAEYRAGNAAGIQQRFRSMETRLQRELGVLPSKDTRALHDQLLAALAAPRGQARSPDEVPRPWPLRESRRLRSVGGLAAASLAIAGLAGGAYLIEQGRASAEPTRIAVLPFRAMGGVDGLLADGLSEELLSQLASNPRLKVTGRTSSWLYKDRAADLRQVGRDLGVDYLVEGSMRQQGGKLLVTAQLINASDATAVWSRSYRGSEHQAGTIQLAIGGAIPAALKIGAPAADQARAAQGQAYSLYLRAKGLIRQRSESSLTSARDLLLEAVRIDPKFAPAWAQLGGAMRLLAQFRFDAAPRLPDGRELTARSAVEHALKLDPNLSDAHAMMGLLDGFSTPEGHDHLRRAMALDPRNPQTLYWWAGVQHASGHVDLYRKLNMDAAALDPLWQRPVEAVVTASAAAGDEAAVHRYLDAIRSGNPKGAAEVEAALAMERGDMSRVVEIALRGNAEPFNSAMIGAAYALITTGHSREGVLVGRLEDESMIVLGERTPDVPTLLRIVGAAAEVGQDTGVYAMIFWRLGQERRWSDIVALYDSRIGLMRDLGRAIPTNRQMRVSFAAMTALALAKVGRRDEARRLLRVIDEADRTFLSNRVVIPATLVQIAGNEALLGRRDKAIALLERAFARGWRMYDLFDAEIGQDPMFATLRGDPRFERLRRINISWRAKERREIAALGVI